MGANPIYEDVKGAPVKIGQKVTVIMRADETLPRRFLGKTGIVEYLEYDCGCGQEIPGDPMIGVRFSPRQAGEFWAEELGFKPIRTH